MQFRFILIPALLKSGMTESAGGPESLIRLHAAEARYPFSDQIKPEATPVI